MVRLALTEDLEGVEPTTFRFARLHDKNVCKTDDLITAILQATESTRRRPSQTEEELFVRLQMVSRKTEIRHVFINTQIATSD